MYGTRYFSHISCCFHYAFMGCGRDEQRPNSRGGIFGHVKAFISGFWKHVYRTLHLHSLLWLYRMVDGWLKLADISQNKSFRNSFLAFTHIVQRHSAPLPTDAMCPTYLKAPAAVVAVEPSSVFITRVAGRTEKPENARCAACKQDFGHGDVLHASSRHGMSLSHRVPTALFKVRRNCRRLSTRRLRAGPACLLARSLQRTPSIVGGSWLLRSSLPPSSSTATGVCGITASCASRTRRGCRA